MAKNIDINVRAQDQASKTLREVSDQVAILADRLAGTDSLVASSAAAANAMNRLADTSHRIEILAVSVGALVAAVGTVKMIARTLAAPINAFVEWTDATKGLTEAQLEYIQTIERSVGVSDRVAADLLGLASAYGIAADQQDDVVTGAIGLAETLDQNVNGVILKLSDLLNGNEKALDSIIPQLRDMATAEEKIAEVERLAAEGLASKNEAMSELEGAQIRYNAALENMARIIGEAVAPAVTAFLNITTALADAIGNVLHSAMGMIHRDFAVFAADLFDVTKLTEFFELALLSIEKTFVQFIQAFAGLTAAVAGQFSNVEVPAVEAFLQEVELRLADIDRRADAAIGRRLEAEANADKDSPQKSALSLLMNPGSPAVPEFELKGIFDNLAGAISKDDKDKKKAGDTELVAMESRLLNSGATVSSAQMTAKNTEATAKTLLNIKQILQNQDQQQDAFMLKVNQA